MKISSSDAPLVDAFDGALAIPQRRGVPLPRMLGLLMDGAAGFLAAEAAVCMAIGIPSVALAIVVLAAANAALTSPQRAIYRTHAQGWGPDVAATYRSHALWHRHAMVRIRAFQAMAPTLFLAYVLPRLDWTRAGIVMLVLAPIVGTCACIVGHQYSACAMPRDPDARRRVAIPAEGTA